ncbi:LolA family protein [Gaopeijia maritima]|uniref:Outer membrane lipoprotein carrier protein LolA n=1 Tax=Gaopeijia maritima TaxID=3119007 RepID=A0ABU9EDH0_9BACT
MTSLRFLFATTVLFGGTGGLAGQDSGMAVLEAASERYAALGGLCADFVQVLDNPILGDAKTTRGRLCQETPNLFRMDFSDPEGDEVVADGEWFWVYYRSLDESQVLRFPLDDSRGGMDFFREFLSEPASKYSVAAEGVEQMAGTTTHRLALTPLSPRGLVSARIWVDPSTDLIRRIEVTEDNGLTRTVTLSNLALDPSMGAAHFTFTVPPGVDVVSNE